MQVMVLDQDQNLQVQLAGALMQKGFHVICVESIGAAENFIRRDFIDVLVMGERVGGKLSHSLALLAECRNPLVSAILLTDRTGPSLEEIFDLIPSINGILGRKISPAIVAQVVLASTIGQTSETVHDRLANRWAAAAAAADEAADPASVYPVMDDAAGDLDTAGAVEAVGAVEAADAVEATGEPLPLLVLTDPQRAEPAFDLAGWGQAVDAGGLSQAKHRDFLGDDDQMAAERPVDDIRAGEKAAERPAATRAKDAFAPGWPQDGNRSPFYHAMADLPCFADLAEEPVSMEQVAPVPLAAVSLPMPPRPMTRSEAAGRRMHLA